MTQQRLSITKHAISGCFESQATPDLAYNATL